MAAIDFKKAEAQHMWDEAMKAIQMSALTELSMKPHPYPSYKEPPQKMEEFTGFWVPGIGGENMEIRMTKSGDMVNIRVGDAEFGKGLTLSVRKAVLKQLVDKLYEELNMERLGK